MRLLYSSISLIALMTLMVSCGKTPVETTDGGVPICFSVNTMQTKTKGIYITTETLKDAMVIVNGTEGNAIISYNGNDLKIKPESEGSNNWFPTNRRGNVDNNWHTWQPNTSYTFQAYAYTPTNATNNNEKLTVTSPTNITVHQPKTYSYKNESTTMVDYLLAHNINVPNGSRKPIVNLIFEHALSMVEIYVLRDDAITAVEVSNLTFKKFYTDIKLQALNGAAINDKDYTDWTPYTIANTTRDGNYVMSGSTFSTISNRTERIDFDSRFGTGSGKEQNPAIMRAIVAPQTLLSSANNEEGTSVSVTYRVNMARTASDTAIWTESMTQTFPLVAEGLPARWEPGYKYTYIIIIDPGVHFTAKVSRWVDGGNIEATILPEILEGGNNNSNN